MRIGFLTNKLTLRGTEVCLYDYADYNEKILNNESVIITRPYDWVVNISPRALSKDAYKKFNDRFQVEYYYNPWDIPDIVKREKIDVLFIEKAGSKDDGLVFDCCKTIIHAVFTTKDPHGDLYAPISQSVNEVDGTNFPVLPYMVNVHNTHENLRKELGIPDDAIVFGSYSGNDEYTLEYVKKTVCDIIKNPEHSNIYFIYLNIDKFGPDSERLKFLPGTYDMNYKRQFINTCDAMLYGRVGGETFGLACGEFLVSGKQVIARPGEHSFAHEVMLGDNMVKHTSYDEVYDIITNWSKYKKEIVACDYHTYTPIHVMKLFKAQLDNLFPKELPRQILNNQYYKNSIIFCTAFKDIGRKNWSNIPRTNETYIEYFMNLANNIEYKLVVFVEKPMYDILIEKNLKSNIELRLSSEVKTFYDEYIDSVRDIMFSKIFQDKVPEIRKYDIDFNYPEYLLVNHNKFNYVAHTKNLYPNYEYYSWIDFGCIRRTIDDVPKNINFSKLHNKISYLAIKMPPADHTISSEEMVASVDVYLAGSQYIAHRDLVEVLENKYKDVLEEWKQEYICDEDQSAILQVYFKNRDLFEIFPNSEWFSLFRNFLNSHLEIKNKNDIHKLINMCGLTGTYAEIGVCAGEFTEYILKNTSLTKLLLIDPYINFDSDDYKDGINKYNMEELFNSCKSRLASYSDRIEFIRKLSTDAAQNIKDNSLDVVYIDGNHEYKYVMEDLENYWPKIRLGGILFGDDVYEYSENDKNVLKLWDGKPAHLSESYGLYGVHNAVIDFCKQKHITYHIFGNQFYIYKF